MTRLGDVCDYVTDKATVGENDATSYISTENMIPNRGGVTLSTTLPVGQKGTSYRQGDVLVSNIRPYFKKIWPANCSGICSNDVLVFRAKGECTKSFLYHLLSSEDFFAYDTKTSKGTKMPRGDKRALMQYEFDLPSLPDQQRIGSLLDSINAQIDNLTRTNRHLEQLGLTLIGSYAEAANETIALQELLRLGNGFAFKSGTYDDCGKYKVLTIKNVQDGIVDCTDSNRITSLPGKLQQHCILERGNVVLSLTGNVGRVGIVAEDDCLLNQRVAVFIPSSKSILPGLYFWFRQSSFKNEMIGIARGTAQANLSPIETLRLEIPWSPSMFETVSDQCRPLFKAILANKTESRRLEELRDTLLPRLMSGEIDVSEMELPKPPNGDLCE